MTTARKGSLNRDIALSKIEDEKRTSFIKAWVDGEKSKIENKASIEAKLKKIEEEIERKKAEYSEKMKNKVALVHKEAEEKKSLVLCKRSEELLQVKEMRAKFRVSRHVPKKALLRCFG
ncbi:hypothetical protein DM860_004588 [Cuscuta australis]|uniref:Remorin C-terminal domain-containing protein n=1 Tax=Cuscuta australis TaxID=267555 RepID=A0A328E897_9ASTE|nr:hypothetical protein DM860_004588 [Cuscuta australis]